ncbi:MAG: hypothetical protein P1U57_06400, partial [Oleibacter sp.]|nr:hypothetical protein [Thalassolituus sp.]
MSPAQRLQFDKAPSIFSQASRSLFARSSGTKNFQLPDLDAAFYGIVPDQKNIKAYSAICGFDTNSEFLPITYPHILGFKLHLELMLHRTFPLGPMGMVHLSNTVIQHRDIKKTESLDIRVLFDGHEKTDKGIEVKLRTETRVGMELVWEGSSTYLAIIPNKTAKKKEKKERP